ncbi:hypothetical protein [Streptosporangium pseudovulgare]|uniref:Uncharacterized protein n=1 Tax=Streptosporangium pseudovulgare TaxID=35765 RepID=A0ABQ2RHH4_9ACTN|nr:hypothetical protein [Streptosporangium pseudovulgare]GGQ32418.1 hypothetical protein GCM10010140_73060 [Streptosporangium pseudovulgare]
MAFSERFLRVPPPIRVGGRHVKRYHVTADPAGIEPEVEKAACALDRPGLDAYLAGSLPEGAAGDRP